MIHIHSIPSQFLLSSPLKYITPPNESLTCVQIWQHLQIYTINWNGNTLLCVWLIINLFLPNYIIFVYYALHDSSISVDCTNILLLQFQYFAYPCCFTSVGAYLRFLHTPLYTICNVSLYYLLLYIYVHSSNN